MMQRPCLCSRSMGRECSAGLPSWCRTGLRVLQPRGTGGACTVSPWGGRGVPGVQHHRGHGAGRSAEWCEQGSRRPESQRSYVGRDYPAGFEAPAPTFLYLEGTLPPPMNSTVILWSWTRFCSAR